MARVLDGVAADLRHGELEVGELDLTHLRLHGDAGQDEPAEDEVVGLGRDRELDGGAHEPCSVTAPSSRPRMIASERRSSLETCIWEMPMRDAISDWVSPS